MGLLKLFFDQKFFPLDAFMNEQRWPDADGAFFFLTGESCPEGGAGERAA